MRFFLSIAILLGTAVTATVCFPTLSTIQGPSQGTSTISALADEDCLSNVDWLDIVFITAVPIAAGFGLLMLLAFLQDLRQAKKSDRSSPSPPSPTIGGNRARKERTYVIDVAYARRSCWYSFLRRCAKRKSSGARTNQRLVRLKGTFGFSNWTPFDLTPGKKSERKMITTTHSIGKLVAVELKYPSMSRRINSRQLPSSNICTCLLGLINRACDMEIKNIHVLDTKTQDQFVSDCCRSSGGISSSEQGITTLLPLLPFTAKPEATVSHFAYFIKNASLLTSTFIPWHEGNFTGIRHVTCLFAHISYTMFATQVMSEFYLAPSLDEIIVVSFSAITVTMAIVIRAAVVGTVVFVIVGVIEVVFRGAPTIWSMPLACISPPAEEGDSYFSGFQPHQVQSTAGDFYGGDRDGVEEGLLRKSSSAPEMQQRLTGTDRDINNYGVLSSKRISKKGGASSEARYDKYVTVSCREASQQTGMTEAKSLGKPDGNPKPDLKTTDRPIYGDNCGDDQSICPENMLECQHKLTCHKCIVCKRTTGSRFYSPGASTSSGYALNSYNDLYGVESFSDGAYLSSSCDSDISEFHTDGSFIVSQTNSLSSLTSISSEKSSEFESSDNFGISNRPFHPEPATPYQQTRNPDYDSLNVTTECETSHRHSTLHEQPDSVDIATSTSGLALNRQKTSRKQEAGDGNLSTRWCGIREDEAYIREGFTVYSSALKDSNISSAKVIRTKNYINKFTDMGKGKVVFLTSDPDNKTYESRLTNKTKTKTKKPAGAKCSQSASKKAKVPSWDPVNVEPVDYIIDTAMEFEMPSVTVQMSGSAKLLLFSIRKWLGGLLFKSKVKVGDDYKLEITENDSSIKISDEHVCLKSMPKETVEDKITDQKDDIITSVPKMNLAADHLQGSIFESSSRLIKYTPSVKGVASSHSWDSISSAQGVIQQGFTARLTGKNKNNNSIDTTVIEMEPYTGSSSTTITDDDFSPDTTASSRDDSDLSSVSLRMVKVTESKKDHHNHNAIPRTRFEYFQAIHAANPTAEAKSIAEYYQPIGFLICHILVILSCATLTVWSVFSVDGMCLGVFWEWVAVSIIAVLIQVFILDMIKAGILTLCRWYYILQDAKAKPYSVIY